MHEASLNEKRNSYVTLTYRDSELPKNGTLCHRDFQLFLKKLRRKVEPLRFRYYMCGEYGDAFQRPHYHALLFGLDFPDKLFLKRIKGNPAYTSELLGSVWTKGFHSIGAVTMESASYVARYILKKQKGKNSWAHYLHVDKDTGELIRLEPEYTRMSLKPTGIGGEWFERFSSDVFPDDFCVIAGRKYKTPRYYDSLLRQRDDAVYQRIKDTRRARAVARKDNSRERLEAREICATRRVENMTRPYESGEDEWT